MSPVCFVTEVLSTLRGSAPIARRKGRPQAIANATGVRVLAAVGAAVPVRMMKRDLLFVIEKLVSLMEEPRLEMLARQHGIRQKRDDGGIGKTLAAYIRRADEGTLSRLLVETSILLAVSRSNPATILRDAASMYKVDTDALGNDLQICKPFHW
jgi:ParB family transcriptional regulator, chromosome partitioning protein